MRARALIVSVTIATLLLMACAQTVPPEQVRLYAETAAKTRDAGGVILDRIAPIIANPGQDGQADCGPDPNTGIPRCFDQRLVTASVGPRSEPPAVAINRLALDLMAAYAAVLADLAEGKSAADVRAGVGVAADVAGALLTVTGAAAPVGIAVAALRPKLQDLAGQLEAARVGQIVRQTLIADREIIKALLKALEDETPRIYDIYRLKRELDLLAAARVKDRAAADAVLADIKNFYAALEAYVRLLRASSAALDVLARDAQQTVPPNSQAVQASLKQAIDARAESQMLWNTVRQLEPARR